MAKKDGFSGRLSVVPLPELLLRLQADSVTGEIRLETDFGLARIWQRDGVLVDAQMGVLRGTEAVDRLLGVEDAAFRVQKCNVDRKRTIKATLQSLLTRRSRRQEEWDSIVERLPALDSIVLVDEGALASSRIGLNAAQGRLLKLIDGKRKIAEILEDSDEDPLEMLRQLAKWHGSGVVHAQADFAPVPQTSRVFRGGRGRPEAALVSTQIGISGENPAAGRGTPSQGSPALEEETPIPLTSAPKAQRGVSKAKSRSSTSSTSSTQVGIPQMDDVSWKGPAQGQSGSRSGGSRDAQKLGQTTRLGLEQLSSSRPPPPIGGGKVSNPTPNPSLNVTRLGVPGLASQPPAAKDNPRDANRTRTSRDRTGELRRPATTRKKDMATTRIGGSSAPAAAGRTRRDSSNPQRRNSGQTQAVKRPRLTAQPEVQARFADATAAPSPPADGSSGEELEGQVASEHAFAKLGRYEVLSRLGRGGMGSVYLARLRAGGGFNRYFAVKVLRANLSKDRQAARLLQTEARIGSLLHHPNVISVVDVGEEGGQQYLVMEYVRGCTVATLLRNSSAGATTERVLGIILDALTGLAALHQLTDDAGEPLRVNHNDVSPENLVVGLDGVTRLSDFGVATLGGIAAGKPGPKGKPGYLSPERALNEATDQRSDIFAMGVVLWTALTGQPLFEGKSSDQTIRNVLKAKIPRPSEIGRRPPSCLDQVCLRALARNPEDRYDSVEQFITELRAVAASQNLTTSATSVGEWARTATGKEPDVHRLAFLDASRAAKKAGQDGAEDDLDNRIAMRLDSAPPSSRQGGSTVSIQTKKKPGVLKTLGRWLAVATALGVMVISLQALETVGEQSDPAALPPISVDPTLPKVRKTAASSLVPRRIAPSAPKLLPPPPAFHRDASG